MEAEIKIIKGDSLDLTLTIENIELELIEHVYFSSRNLLTREFLWDEPTEKYRLRIAAEETEEFPVGRASYDITIMFIDEGVRTAKYKGPLIVHPKDNRVITDG
jgi:tRNA splicing endonuclease